MMFSSGYGRKSALHPRLRSTRTSGGVVRFQGTMCQPLVVLKHQADKESVPRTLAWTTIRGLLLAYLSIPPYMFPSRGQSPSLFLLQKASIAISSRAFILIRYPKLQTPVHTRCPQWSNPLSKTPLTHAS
ncbi:hypothetical protein DPMN_170543 [Dreissena polymorpha]|uniref:Uncharacterized protein n=1 Tax=Dreissena polymorpha TaxID=45954 RepID=A0A9D4IEP3_DREPO|nr:hypothetical protein DPMN_170543 [Dreissena polymorpha]